jgi:hypothetical protein
MLTIITTIITTDMVTETGMAMAGMEASPP